MGLCINKGHSYWYIPEYWQPAEIFITPQFYK